MPSGLSYIIMLWRIRIATFISHLYITGKLYKIKKEKFCFIKQILFLQEKFCFKIYLISEWLLFLDLKGWTCLWINSAAIVALGSKNLRRTLSSLLFSLLQRDPIVKLKLFQIPSWRTDFKTSFTVASSRETKRVVTPKRESSVLRKCRPRSNFLRFCATCPSDGVVIARHAGY